MKPHAQKPELVRRPPQLGGCRKTVLVAAGVILLLMVMSTLARQTWLFWNGR